MGDMKMPTVQTAHLRCSDDRRRASPEPAGSSSTGPSSRGSFWQRVHEWTEPALWASADDPVKPRRNNSPKVWWEFRWGVISNALCGHSHQHFTSNITPQSFKCYLCIINIILLYVLWPYSVSGFIPFYLRSGMSIWSPQSQFSPNMSCILPTCPVPGSSLPEPAQRWSEFELGPPPSIQSRCRSDILPVWESLLPAAAKQQDVRPLLSLWHAQLN